MRKGGEGVTIDCVYWTVKNQHLHTKMLMRMSGMGHVVNNIHFRVPQ